MKLSGTLLASAVTAALGGFLFGFDTVVISGAEQKFQAVWSLNDYMHGLATGAALWGTVLGALAGNLPTDRLGRRGTLMWIGVLYFVSAVWSGLAPDVYSFMIARFIGGIGVGVSTVAAPLYISEIAPPGKRGLLAGMFQFNIVFGILIAFASNAMIDGVSENDWRWMLGVEAIPAILYTLMVFRIPESPRWLIGLKRKRAQGEEVLAQLNPDASPEEVATLASQIEDAAQEEERVTGGAILSARLSKPIKLAFLVALFNQFSGINAILYFAPRILGMAGVEDPRTGQIWIGVVNLVFTMLGLWLIDRAGRKQLLLYGSFGYILSLSIASATFYSNQAPLTVASDALSVKQLEQRLIEVEASGESGAQVDSVRVKAAKARLALVESTKADAYEGEPVELGEQATHKQAIATAQSAADTAGELVGRGGTIVLLAILAFIASHAVGQGAVIWVLISEVFPNEHRAIGNSLGSSTHWVCAALITTVFPSAVVAFAPGAIFAFFCFMMVLHLIWVLTMVPETKGIPLEEIQKKLGVV